MKASLVISAFSLITVGALAAPNSDSAGASPATTAEALPVQVRRADPVANGGDSTVSRSVPAAANPDVMDAATKTLKSRNSDPEIQKAQAALADAQKALSAAPEDEQKKKTLETAQLTLELALLKKSQPKKDAVPTVEARKNEITARLAALKNAEVKNGDDAPQVHLPSSDSAKK